MANVVIYTSTPCPFCSRAKALLSARGAEFEEVHIPWDDQEARIALVAKTNHRTMPQIFINDAFVGGFDQLAALDTSGELASLLAEAIPGS